MPKPSWLVEGDNERRIRSMAKYCFRCRHYGKLIKEVKRRTKERVDVHECAIHPGCFNTRYSIGCSDWEGL